MFLIRKNNAFLDISDLGAARKHGLLIEIFPKYDLQKAMASVSVNESEEAHLQTILNLLQKGLALSRVKNEYIVLNVDRHVLERINPETEEIEEMEVWK